MLNSQKPHIGIFGRRNVGKSSIINALTGQAIAIVSDHAGTTTDPVTKGMEIFGVGPVILTDTAGVDDTGELGAKRVARSIAILDRIDLGIIVIAGNAFGPEEERLARAMSDRGTPSIVLHNKSDIAPLCQETRQRIRDIAPTGLAEFCAIDPKNLEEVIDLIRKHLPPSAHQKPPILGDLMGPGDTVVLVTPCDAEAPEGRLILPQVQAIRDCLDHGGIAVVLTEENLEPYLQTAAVAPRLVVTDSQAFQHVAAVVPRDVLLTSFSILFARLKGDFEHFLSGTPQISNLQDGDRVLMLESCSHHVVGDDIGRVKLPRWISSFTGRSLSFDVVAGLDRPPQPIEAYRLVVQCGGCMLTRTQVRLRLRPALEHRVPVTNYGMAIAWCLGIYDRAIAPFAGAREAPLSTRSAEITHPQDTRSHPSRRS
jgi:[FeFe] hydrogenase H-cluster maturation GTPase HydF